MTAKTKTKHKGGRPKTELDELPTGWQEKLVQLGREGATDVMLRCQIAEWRGSCSDDLFYRWIKEEKEFSRTIKSAQMYCQGFWESQATKGTIGSQPGMINPTAWIFTMKNKFGWKDKQEISGDQSAPLSIIINESGKGSRAD